VKALLALLQNQNREVRPGDNLLLQEDSGDQTSLQPKIPHSPPVDNAAKSLTNFRSQTIAPSISSPLDPTLSELFSRISPATLRYLEVSKSTERNRTGPVEEPSQAALRQAVFACLSRDPDLVKCLTQVRNTRSIANPLHLILLIFDKLMQRQRELEKQLWDERLSITRSYQGEMNVLSRKFAGSAFFTIVFEARTLKQSIDHNREQHGNDVPSTNFKSDSEIEVSRLGA
jgi:hypothetical protein